MSLDNSSSMDEEYASHMASYGAASLLDGDHHSAKRIKLEAVDVDNNNGGSLSEQLLLLSARIGQNGDKSGGLDMRVGRDESSEVGEGLAASSSVVGGGGGIYGSGLNSNNNNNNSDALNNNNTNSNGSGTNSIKSKIGDVDEVKFGEFSKFLADSEKDESMTTVLELLHDNYGLIQRYASGYDCNSEKCQYENLHEHFHCYDTFCRGKVLYKKYEIIRHLKWHKKRKESLKYGFYRFSSSDDCSIQYGHCQHNHKHTHYHCVHDNCDKVYISTSDVQMHANYHRKHEAIVKNGFQRFRATEECNTDHCVFKGQKTTHFHCRRENCKYTFKNKADMEKHKTYHLKDEMLLRDGYKKFLKSEDCTYKNCRFSRVCNHIHCMHENCHYVLHSSGQLLSHKRKHERMDTEVDYRKYQMARSLLSKFGGSFPGSGRGEEGGSPPMGAREDEEVSPSLVDPIVSRNPVLELLAIMSELTFRALPLQMMLHMRMQMLQNMSYEQILAPENVDGLRKLAQAELGEEYLKQLYKFNEETCHLGERATIDANAAVEPAAAAGQTSPLSSLPRGFADQPPLKRRLLEEPPASTSLEAPYFNVSTLSKSKLLSNPSVDYRLLKKDDSGLGESSSEASSSQMDRQKNMLESSNFLQFTSSKTLFNRKRGRPRKNHVMEVYNNVQDSPQAIFTSFKLEKADSKPAVDTSKESPAMVPEVELRFRKDFPTLKTHEDRRSPPKGFYPMESAPPMSSLFGSPDFGGFSQILEKHMREIKVEPSATVTHEMDLSNREKPRNHLKCVVCNNLFETFADIKGARVLTLHQPPFRGGVYPQEVPLDTSRMMYQPVPLVMPPLPPQQVAAAAAKDSISLVKTTGTFYPDVNANKLKYF
ncbi:hypothetical protein quinque_009425 [Culex quinquefasciatus]